MATFENMEQSTLHGALFALSLDRRLPETLERQLVRQLRRLILRGSLPAGTRLPASRTLADELSVSRSTIVAAMDQLVAEGYAQGRRGSGLYVAANLPDDLPEQDPEPGKTTDLPAPPPVRPFTPAAPDLSLFPHAAWAKLMERLWRAPSADLTAQADPCGYAGLRRAVCNHLAVWRGITCTPRQVVITSGLAEAIGLLARAGLVPGATVFLEDPGYPSLRRTLARNGLQPVAVPVDAQGFDIRRAVEMASDASAAAVTPSRHHPLGMTMPLLRRLDLLEWARGGSRLILEDDYDSEYRFEGQPLPAMMSLDVERVVYLGSFSKVMFPALRLSFMVVPERLTEPASTAIAEAGAQASLLAQPVLARFIDSGMFAVHLRRTRRVYAARAKLLARLLNERMGDLLEVPTVTSGMHLVAHLTPAAKHRMDDREASSRALAAGIVAPALSTFSAGTKVQPGLVLGFAGFGEPALEGAVAHLENALRAPTGR